MKICFEGPSAVGKTKLSESFKNRFKIIPEVHYLFTPPKKTNKFWYYEKQVERYGIAVSSRSKIIFDGDPFQPLWYNWTYGFPKEFPSLSETITFYRKAMSEGRISFPDLYIILQSDEDELVRRKESDKTRTRRNFDKHRALIESQKTYFSFLRENTSVDVRFLDLTDIHSANREVSHLMSQYKVGNKEQNHIDLGRIHTFLEKNKRNCWHHKCINNPK